MSTTVHMIEPDTLRDWLDEGRQVTLLDVRPTSERAEWSIPGSIHIDAYDQLQAGDPDALAGLHLPEDVPVVTICAAGKTSLIAAEQLRARGIAALSLAGGMRAWSLAWNTADLVLPASAAQVVQVRRTGKGCLSYLVGAGDTAAVIDPSVEPQVYLTIARQRGWRIAYVLETHLHADHLSRAYALQQASGATLLLPAGHRVALPFTPIDDGEVVDLGNARLQAIHTPGHTPESTTYLLDAAALFTGDTLFLSAVGRPDLHADDAAARAKAHVLYHSLQRLVALPQHVLVLPGHTSEPIAFDRRAISAPLADVRAHTALLEEDEPAFVEALLARIPPTPPNHAQIIALNEQGVFDLPDPAELEAGANRCAIA